MLGNVFGSIGRALIATLAIATGGTILVAATGGLPATVEARSADRGAASANDAWLDGLRGKQRQLFDSPDPAGGIPLVHILNYYQTYNTAYGVPDREINGIGTFYGGTTFYGLNDAMWAKYRLGEFLKAEDPATGKPAVANPWRTAPVIVGMTLPDASIESLQQRGARFIVCNNALSIFSGLLAKSRGLDAGEVYRDMKASILHGVTLVPAMVIAIEKAQARGIAYHRQ